MRHLLENIIAVHPQNTSSLILASGLALWLVVWLVLAVDILQASRTGIWKFLWLVIASVPLLGGVLFALYMLFSADWSGAFFWRKVTSACRKK
jgi:hypothetical protein